MKSFSKLVFVTSLLFTILLSCSKKIDCDNAQLCVVNIGNDTINYCWNCNSLTEMLLPGEKTCINFGPVHVKKDQFSVIATFESDHGNFFIEANDCYTEKEID